MGLMAKERRLSQSRKGEKRKIRPGEGPYIIETTKSITGILSKLAGAFKSLLASFLYPYLPAISDQ